jgi:hypothetical protein
MSNNELSIRIDTLAKYFDLMNLAIPSQRLLNNFLKERIPSVDWGNYHKNEIAVKYALGQFLTEDDFCALRDHFGIKKYAIDFNKLIKD